MRGKTLKDQNFKNGKEPRDFSLGKRMAMVLSATIFMGEVLVMLFIGSLHIKPFGIEAFVDSLLLSMITFPFIYFFVIRPFSLQESKRQNSLALTEAILESIHNGLLVVSPHGKIIRSNAKFAEMWQIPADLLARGDDQILLTYIKGQLADASGFITRVSELYENPEAESIDLVELTDGRTFKRISKPMYLGGEAQGRVWSFLDITERVKVQEALLKSEANLQTLLYTIPDLIWLKNLEGVYLSCNAMFERLMGLKEDQIIGKNDYDFFETELAEFFRYNDQIAFAAGKSMSNEEWLTFADNGQTDLFDVIKTPMYDAKGTFIGILGMGHNITQRKRMEIALAESEEKYRFLFANNPQPMWIFDLETLAFLEVNQAAVNHYGYSKEEFLGMTIKDIRPEEDLPELLKEIDRVTYSNHSDQVWRHLKRNGESILVEISAHSVIYEGRKARHILIHDISDRKQAEEALQESEAQFRSVLETMSLIGVMIDNKGRVTLCNDYLLDLTGWTREEVLHQNWFELFLPAEIRTDIEVGIFMASFQRGDIPKHVENEIITRHGERRLIAWNNTILHDHHGAISGVASIGEDITERKKAEAEIKLKTELLLKTNTEKDKFFSIVAHDLRSPFNSFLGLTQIMAENLQSLSLQEAQEIAESMNKSATNLYRLLENLLQWSQIEQGAIPFHPKAVQLDTVVGESIEMIQESAKSKGIEIITDITADLQVFADINMLQTIVRNLISNAVKFTPRGGEISLSAKMANHHQVEISIQDSGIGMNQTLLDNLFRIDIKTNRKGTDGEPSTGLGLLLCKEFIEMHGGNICVESEVGKGSKFYFTMPFNDQSNAKLLAENENLSALKASKLSQLKILIADDDEASARLITFLVRAFGREIRRVVNGLQAVEACRENPDIDLVLMDISMPEMNGYEATRQIRQFNSKIIIIAQTAHALNGDSEMALEAGCNDHISKPIKKAELVGLMQKYFKQ
ncbi:MAG TPA: PAS domain S-box protein [Prolixibacteraceae bacterium]